MSFVQSDHLLIMINVSLQKHSVSAKVISYRNYKSIDMDDFLGDMRVSSRGLDLPHDINHPVELYNSTSGDLVDDHGSIRAKEVPRRPLLEWYSKDKYAAKRQGRYCERLWIRIGLCVHYEMISKVKKAVAEKIM